VQQHKQILRAQDHISQHDVRPPFLHDVKDFLRAVDNFDIKVNLLVIPEPEAVRGGFAVAWLSRGTFCKVLSRISGIYALN